MNLAGSKALVVGILAVGAALSSAAADAPRAEPSVKERGLALYADVLGSLDELDRRAATLDHDARAAVVGMWSEHKLQAALDPYSLALFQEGRQRFDPLVSTMREATLEAGYQDRMGIAAARDIDTARITYERGRKRLVAEFGAMRELLKTAGDAADGRPARCARREA
ncbi:MAG: hypothetical protein HC882_07340, partial [Acidobacteria bacterium]|nr:hypothetical protein [Acidobacteriota bacterium]